MKKKKIKKKINTLIIILPHRNVIIVTTGECKVQTRAGKMSTTIKHKILCTDTSHPFPDRKPYPSRLLKHDNINFTLFYFYFFVVHSRIALMKTRA
jgi:hypothetical protein